MIAMAKKKKEKITYVDDGRTIADMSGVTGGRNYIPRSKYTPGPSFKQAWKTYWNAVRMMLVPMLVTIAGIGLIYLIMMIIFGILA